MSEIVEVTQEDRDAARAFLGDAVFRVSSTGRALSEAFARHRLAAEARSHDGEWEAMREAWAKASKFMRHDGLCAIIGGYGYCSCGMDEAKAAMVSAVPLFDEGRL